jgi:mono/diheme cytochrome c family protein
MFGKDFTQPKLVPTSPSGDLAARIRIGATLFQRSCIACHGPDGTGNQMRDSKAMPLIPNFTDANWQKQKENAELVSSILEGKGALMPSNSDKVTRDQAKDLVAYIRSFGPEPYVEETSAPDDEFQRKILRLQRQWAELEQQLKKMEKQ